MAYIHRQFDDEAGRSIGIFENPDGTVRVAAAGLGHGTWDVQVDMPVSDIPALCRALYDAAGLGWPENEGRPVHRSDCRCPCHVTPGMMHVRACCRPDPTPDQNAAGLTEPKAKAEYIGGFSIDESGVMYIYNPEDRDFVPERVEKAPKVWGGRDEASRPDALRLLCLLPRVEEVLAASRNAGLLTETKREPEPLEVAREALEKIAAADFYEGEWPQKVARAALAAIKGRKA
jgi:hypothetical protein